MKPSPWASGVYMRGTGYLVKNLFISLGIAVVLISILMAYMFRSWRMVAVSLIPNIIPLIFTGALMGFLGITIKPSTILVFSIAFGISVDDTITFLPNTVKNWKPTIGASKKRNFALREVGISMAYTSIVLLWILHFQSFNLWRNKGFRHAGKHHVVSRNVLEPYTPAVSITYIRAVFNNQIFQGCWTRTF